MSYFQKRPKKPVYVDVDGTLIFWKPKEGNPPRNIPLEMLYSDEYCEINHILCNWIKETDSPVIVWSMGGEDHAINACNYCGIEDFVDAFLEKPYEIIDDAGVRWLKKVNLLDPFLDEFRK